MDARDDLHIVLFRAVVLILRRDVRAAPDRVTVPGRAAEVAGRQGAIRHERHPELLADRDQLPLVFPIQQVVVVLHHGERRPAVIARDDLHVVELVAIHRGGTERPDFAGFHEVVQSLHRFLDRMLVVKAVNDVEIEVVGPEALQGAINLTVDRLAGKPSLVKVDLRRNHHVLTLRVPLQRFPEILFARPRGVAVRGVKEVDPEVERMLHDRGARVFVERPLVHRPRFSETHAADTHLRDADIGLTEMRIFHFSQSSC